MSYLHHCNPPIIHRDLKSSNLLVDKHWNVKVSHLFLDLLTSFDLKRNNQIII